MGNPYDPRLPSEFRVSGGSETSAPYIVVLVASFVITLVLGTAVTGSAAGGLGVSVAGTLIMAVVLFAVHTRKRTGAVVRFSQAGVELSDAKGFGVRLRWQDMTRIGTVYIQMSNPRQVGLEGGISITVGAMRSTGIIGWGERIVPPDIPAWLRATLDAEPVNPVDGRPQVIVPLGGIDPNWQQGAMGAWLRTYRPDLLPPVSYR